MFEPFSNRYEDEMISNAYIKDTYANHSVIIIEISPFSCIIGLANKIYTSANLQLQAGEWKQKSIPFELVKDSLPIFCRFVKDVAGVDIDIPTKEDFTLSNNRAFVEVSKAIVTKDTQIKWTFTPSCDITRSIGWTLLLYRISKNVKGGGLLIYDSKHGKPLATISPHPIQIGNMIAVVMRSDVFHCPEKIEGEGERDVLIFHLPTSRILSYK